MRAGLLLALLGLCATPPGAVETHPAAHATHPLTPEHAARYRDADLLWSAEQAITERRFDAARSALARHAQEFGGARAEEDRTALTLLARCVEQGHEADRAAARAFYDAHRASPLRRRLRKSCIDAPRAAPAS